MARKQTSMYYDYSEIDGYNCPCKIIISRRGLGKTFTLIKRAVERFVTSGSRFIYVVETGEMVKELCRNNGEKFWSALMAFYAEQNTSRKRYMYNKLTSLEVVTEDDIEVTKIKEKTKVIGGTIMINRNTAGYIVDMNSFAELKRNNFNGVKLVFIDEFISEILDKRALENPKKISSAIQSIARLRKIQIYMCGNSVRLDDPILARMKFKIDKYGWYKRYDKHGLFAVLHFVDPSDYPEFADAYEKSDAGRFAAMLGETAEEENKFAKNLPSDRILQRFEYRKGGWRISVVRDNTVVTIAEMKDGFYACVPFANKNTRTLFCMTEKEQGYRMGYHVMCNTELRKTLMAMLKADVIKYYSEVEYAQLKLIIQGA